MAELPKTHRIGVILAAGRGRRMGRTKQLVPLATATGEKPIVAAAYDAIRPICNDMVVVVGHDADLVADSLAQRVFHRADANPDVPMFESIRAGLTAARGLDQTATIVLQPGDHPEVAESTLAALIACSFQRPAQAIVPQHDGAGGHPVLIPPVVAALLVHADCPGGLSEFWSAHPDLCHRLEVADAGILRDIDTPADLLP